jgi:hypothetical protein
MRLTPETHAERVAGVRTKGFRLGAFELRPGRKWLRPANRGEQLFGNAPADSLSGPATG